MLDSNWLILNITLASPIKLFYIFISQQNIDTEKGYNLLRNFGYVTFNTAAGKA